METNLQDQEKTAFRTSRFRSKTIFKKRDNGDPGTDWPIALDVGYSTVKVFSPNVCAMFPAYAKREQQRFLGDLSSRVILYTDLETGETWTVGEDAQDRIDARDTNDSEAALYGRERYSSAMFKVLVDTGLGMGCISGQYHARGDRPVYVQTGLPPRYMAADKPYLEAVIRGRHRFSLQLGSMSPVAFDITVGEDHIGVMSQPMGTLFSVMMGNDHQITPEGQRYFDSNVIVFDPGFGTLDIFPIRRHHLGNSETADNLGMKRVLSETVKAINERYHQDLSVPVMQKYLETGTFRRVGKDERGRTVSEDVPFNDILFAKNRDVCMEALQWLETTINLPEFDYLIITGGTSAAWQEMIRDYFGGMSTLKIVNGNCNSAELPFTFANVRGYYMYRYGKLENTVKA